MAKFIKYNARNRFSDAPSIVPTKETLDGIENAIRWAERDTPRRLHIYMNDLVFMMAVYNQGAARKMSFGPYDPTQSNTGAAWRLPVRRISNNYYLGWKVRQPRFGIAQLYNDSREAFFIEFGINPRGAGRRVRRPIRKLSLRKTLDFMRTTQAFHRVWANIFADPKYSSGFSRGFHQIVQAPGGSYVKGWENVSKQTAQNVLRNSKSKTMRGAGIRVSGGKFQRAVYNRGGGAYGKGGAYGGGGAGRYGRRLP